MSRFGLFLVLFAGSAVAGNLVQSVPSSAVTPETARVVINEAALLAEDPSVTLDGVSHALSRIDIDWRTGGDFKAEFVIGSSAFISMLTKHAGYFAGVFQSPDGSAHELIPDASGQTLRRASGARPECHIASAVFESAQTVRRDSQSLPRRRAAGSNQYSNQNFVVDLVEFWTPAAEVAAGGSGPMEAFIRTAVDILNSDTRQSGISNLAFRLVHVGRLEITEAGLLGHWSSFRSSQEVANVRTLAGGDLAGLWTAGLPSVAFAPQWRSAFNRDNSFHMVSLLYDLASRTYSHEIFHNFGGQHNEGANEYSAKVGVDEYPFARDMCTENWTTILAYPSCVSPDKQIPVIPYITNPDLQYDGVSLGERDKMDNARMVRMSTPWIADYYASVRP